MQDFINKLKDFSIFKDFSDKEFSIIYNEKYRNILLEILNLDSKNLGYVSVSTDYIKYSENIESKLRNVKLQNGFHIFIESKECIKDLVYRLKPWRKGPFFLHFIDSKSSETFYINSEWQSDIKLDLMLRYLKELNFSLKGKDVLDVGCNNGYYMFDFSLDSNVTGLEPMAIFFLQFLLMWKLCNCLESNLPHFRLLGVQDIMMLNKKFDFILCAGVLYHRQEPLSCLKLLKKGLKNNGLLLLETLIINDDSQNALCPYPSYAGMKNVYYIFSPKALQNLAYHAGFKSCEMLHFSYTTNVEQRSSEFLDTKSLGDFLDTRASIEGYTAPCRALFSLAL